MPVLQTTTLLSPPTNAFGLIQYCQQRLPGYDPSEYLRELNSAYKDVWKEISKLQVNYFTNIATVTVVAAQLQYDLMFNGDSALSAAVSQRLYQIKRLRVMSPNSQSFQKSVAKDPNDPEFLGLANNPAAQPATTGPYFWYPTGRNQVRFALPLVVGTQLEVTYSFGLIDLATVNDGTISSSGITVTGNGSHFTQLLQPDFQANLPATYAQEEILAELVYSVNNGNQVSRIKAITSDTSLTTSTAISPILAQSSPYVLATVPEIPHGHTRVIACIALRNMYSVAGDDSRVSEWTAYAANDMQMMKDALQERQGQNPPTKKRFPGSIARRGAYSRY